MLTENGTDLNEIKANILKLSSSDVKYHPQILLRYVQLKL